MVDTNIDVYGILYPLPLPSPFVSFTSARTDTTVILPLDEVERKTIIHALKVTNNNISDAARALGIGRNTLYRKLEKYNLLP